MGEDRGEVALDEFDQRHVAVRIPLGDLVRGAVVVPAHKAGLCRDGI